MSLADVAVSPISPVHRSFNRRASVAERLLTRVDEHAWMHRRFWQTVSQFDILHAKYTETMYTGMQTHYGGLVSIIVSLIVIGLVYSECMAYIQQTPKTYFDVDPVLYRKVNVRWDLVIAMNCDDFSMRLVDAGGDVIMLNDVLKTEQVFFEDAVNYEKSLDENVLNRMTNPFLAFLRRQLDLKRQSGQLQPDACHLSGSTLINKVTGRIQVMPRIHMTSTAVGPLVTLPDHINFSHVIHSIQFGDSLYGLPEPALTRAIQETTEPMTSFQYFLKLVPTTFRSGGQPWKRVTYLYSATMDRLDVSNQTDSQKNNSPPGIHWSYDFDPIRVSYDSKPLTLRMLLIRLSGIVGGVVTVSGRLVQILSWLFAGKKSKSS